MSQNYESGKNFTYLQPEIPEKSNEKNKVLNFKKDILLSETRIFFF